MTAVAPWAMAEIEPDEILAELRRRFPRVTAWRGEFTGRWWALTPDRSGRDRLVEAGDPAELGRLLEDVRQAPPPRPRYERAAQRPDTKAQRTPLPPAPHRAPAPRTAPRTPSSSPTRPAQPGHGRHERRGWWRRTLGALVALE
ncbi:hypothetical protein ACFY4C_24580 [Actinomadura viridis]|uniref:hypothetical protein n=1 Tax=Actinomadura viridis TaxID=58110 RepID=UPI0036AC8122